MGKKMFIDKGKCKKTLEILVYVWLVVLNMFCDAVNEKENGTLYVLMWTDSNKEPFSYWQSGRKSLIMMNCKFQNCYFTDDETYFQDPTEYDAILFNAPHINSDMRVPSTRAEKQIYVFVSIESASNFPMPEKYDKFFNYTWSYMLSSDIPYPYFYVRNKFNGKVIAPRMSVHWRKQQNMRPTPEYVKEHLLNKSICAAWFVTNCDANNRRLDYVRRLRTKLHKLSRQIDIFGHCDENKDCPNNNKEECYELVRANYYFYLSFENSFSEDYVTEKLLTAVNNYAVPVVFGGANYSRFLPEGSYLDARNYTAKNLANLMNNIIMNKEDYYNYFKFHRYYTYHTVGESEDTDPLCSFCKFINNKSIWNDRRIYPQFSLWWNSFEMVPKGPFIVTDDQLKADHPEWWHTATETDNNNFVIDFVNYYFKSRK